MTSFERITLASSVAFTGIGIHSGEESCVHMRPNNEGIVFLHNKSKIHADPEKVTDCTRSTSLGDVRTIEHLMSALAGLGITDAEIEVEGPEIPILDGSAREFCRGLECAGTQPLGKRRSFFLSQEVWVQEGGREIRISPGDGVWRYAFVPGGRWSLVQEAVFHLSPEVYVQEVAPARTFVLAEEIEELKSAGLGLGGSEENTLVLSKEGFLTPPRFPDEPARHKLLDLIGDLALCGIPPWYLNVEARGSGHCLNVEAAKRLKSILIWEEG
jgi:UDP-3-O-[3-hydroxymyristoyl] N-acetylglucosamine deacetylase